jgi:hypothetical protein
MIKWEYITDIKQFGAVVSEESGKRNLIEYFSLFGEKGWELVHYDVTYAGIAATAFTIWKRPISD